LETILALSSRFRGFFQDETQQLGDLYDTMVQAGVASNGDTKKELDSVMKMAILSEGELLQWGGATWLMWSL